MFLYYYLCFYTIGSQDIRNIFHFPEDETKKTYLKLIQLQPSPFKTEVFEHLFVIHFHYSIIIIYHNNHFSF